MLARHRSIRHYLVCFALLALGLRSLIPVGYMPDFSGHGKGLFPITICDGFEHITQDAHTPDCPMHSHGSHGHGGLCPFGGSALVGFNPVIAPVLLGSAYTAALSTPVISQLSDKQAVFTSASPRSPPFSS